MNAKIYQRLVGRINDLEQAIKLLDDQLKDIKTNLVDNESATIQLPVATPDEGHVLYKPRPLDDYEWGVLVSDVKPYVPLEAPVKLQYVVAKILDFLGLEATASDSKYPVVQLWEKEEG